MRLSLTIHLVRRVLSCLLVCWAIGAIAAQPISDNLPPGASLGSYLGMNDLPNLRDIGGYVTSDGKVVVRGKTYRSNAFYPMNAIELKTLGQLVLKNDYDLRTTIEIRDQPDNIPATVQYAQLNVMADNSGVILPPAQITELFQDPKLASEKLGGVDGVEAQFVGLYRELVTLSSANESYRELFLSISEQDNSPNVFHCTNGKDRTGWAAAALLTLIGVPEEVVYEDYLRSNEYLLPMHQKEIDDFSSKGGDKEIPKAIFGVKRRYLAAAFKEMQDRYGTVERYFAEGLGINEKEQQKIKRFYLRVE